MVFRHFDSIPLGIWEREKSRHQSVAFFDVPGHPWDRDKITTKLGLQRKAPRGQ